MVEKEQLGSVDIRSSNHKFESHEESLNLVDFRRVIFRGLKYWYIVVFSIVFTLTIAFSINRYSTKLYSIEASIIIKESDQKAGAKLLYNNPLINPDRNAVPFMLLRKIWISFYMIYLEILP